MLCYMFHMTPEQISALTGYELEAFRRLGVELKLLKEDA